MLKNRVSLICSLFTFNLKAKSKNFNPSLARNQDTFRGIQGHQERYYRSGADARVDDPHGKGTYAVILRQL